MTELQKALLAHMEQLGFTREKIKTIPMKDNPYPINGRYIWYLTKGIVKGKHTEIVMQQFFEQIETEDEQLP